MPRILLLLADGHLERDVHDVRNALLGRGAEVVTAGLSAGAAYKSDSGRSVQADKGFLDLNLHSYQAVVVPGGAAADALAAHTSMVNIVYTMAHKGRAIATIGRGVRVLVPAGALDGPHTIPTGIKVLRGPLLAARRVTGDAAVREELEKAGAVWRDERQVVDGPLFTCRDVEGDALARFADTLLPMAHLVQLAVA